MIATTHPLSSREARGIRAAIFKRLASIRRGRDRSPRGGDTATTADAIVAAARRAIGIERMSRTRVAVRLSCRCLPTRTQGLHDPRQQRGHPAARQACCSRDDRGRFRMP
jgi:hypothetical protein